METEHGKAGTVAAGREETAKEEELTLYLQLKTCIWGINVFQSPVRQSQTNTDDVVTPKVVCDVDIHDGGRFPPDMAAFQLDSKIYLVGGGGPNSGAYVYELCPQTSQLQIPTAIPHRLKSPKVNPIAENIAGKIHVLDRDLQSPPSCHEVLEFSVDSKTWNWNSLPPPPLPPNSTIPLYFVLAHKLFVQRVGGHEESAAAYFFFDTISNSWIPNREPLVRSPPSPSSAATDDFQLMGGRTLRNCPGFDAIKGKNGNPLHVFVAYQGDFDVIGENKYVGAFLVDGGGGEGRVVAYQSLETALFGESSDSGGDFYPEEYPYGVVDLGDGVISSVIAGYRDDERDVVLVCVLRLSKKPSFEWTGRASWALEEEFLDVEVLDRRVYGLDGLEESLRSPVCSAFLL
ncbi:unnamed protein product [Linum trigynum]|uniref:Uncharacterized protein n=1 Tax=Linum trigynum TaxID=586398 RepID=A0AAV2DN06_9ROSI